jgi:SAM-dependent methyltransferase
MHNKEMDEYYTDLFIDNPLYSTPFPNLEEACRWSKIGEFLSAIFESNSQFSCKKLRILDVGCGRGWLTYLANVYGECEGIDPVENSIRSARNLFPNLKFYAGLVSDLLKAPDFCPYDVIVTSEVIEHVVDKETFVRELSECLVPGGYVIVTTPRGEDFKAYLKSGYPLQPVEEWITERELCSLFGQNCFSKIAHDRAYIDLSLMSPLHHLVANARFVHLLRKLGLAWLHKGLTYSTAIYQVWCFQKCAN